MQGFALSTFSRTEICCATCMSRFHCHVLQDVMRDLLSDFYEDALGSLEKQIQKAKQPRITHETPNYPKDPASELPRRRKIESAVPSCLMLVNKGSQQTYMWKSCCINTRKAESIRLTDSVLLHSNTEPGGYIWLPVGYGCQSLTCSHPRTILDFQLVWMLRIWGHELWDGGRGALMN